MASNRARLWIAALLMASAEAAWPGRIADVRNTPHNLSTTSPGTVKATTESQICVFCHTPHAADTTAPVPLWNKRLSTGATYTTYASLNSSTIDGQILAVGSISLACLSCHDGTQAMDNIINAPGSGGYDATGGGTNGLAYTWTGNATAVGLMNNTLTTIGPDLTNDHPIGIRYCGGGQNSTTPAGACTDADFKGPGTGLQSATINSNLVWWVDTAGGTANRDRTDMILYTRTFTAGTNPGSGPSVECGSCHDPHVESGTGTPAAGATFLRISNAGSAVCLACHVK